MDEDIDITTDSIVTQAMSRIKWVCDVEVEPSTTDVQEKELVITFVRAECGCLLWNKRVAPSNS